MRGDVEDPEGKAKEICEVTLDAMECDVSQSDNPENEQTGNPVDTVGGNGIKHASYNSVSIIDPQTRDTLEEACGQGGFCFTDI